MREREGKHLAKDLIHRLKAMRKKIKEVRALHPDVVKQYRAALLDRIQKAGLPIPSDDERVLKEISFFADRVRRFGGVDATAKVILLSLRIICEAKNRLDERWSSSHRKFFANSTPWARKRMMLQSPSALSPARPIWRRFANKSRTLNKQFSRQGILFVISAPSGAGKTTLVEALRKTSNFLLFGLLHHTSTAQPVKSTADDYRFLAAAEFHARVEAGDFLEHAKVHGDHYGTLREPVR